MVDRRAYRSQGNVPAHSPEEDDTTYHREGYVGEGPEGHFSGRGVEVLPTSLPGALAPPSEEEGPYRGLGPRNFRRSDELIYDDVCERLFDDSHIDASGLEVSCRDGAVHLGGRLADEEQLRRTVHLIDRVPGVREVEEHVQVA